MIRYNFNNEEKAITKDLQALETHINRMLESKGCHDLCMWSLEAIGDVLRIEEYIEMIHSKNSGGV